MSKVQGPTGPTNVYSGAMGPTGSVGFGTTGPLPPYKLFISKKIKDVAPIVSQIYKAGIIKFDEIPSVKDTVNTIFLSLSSGNVDSVFVNLTSHESLIIIKIINSSIEFTINEKVKERWDIDEDVLEFLEHVKIELIEKFNNLKMFL